MTDNNEERAAFEHWASDEWHWPRAVERDPGGNYKLMSTNMYWCAWKARAAISRKPKELNK